jgi:hypothetical protein
VADIDIELYIELSRSPNGFLNHFRIQVAVSEVKRPLNKNGKNVMTVAVYATAIPPTEKCPFGCNVYIAAVAVGQRQRLYSDVRMFTWFYLRSINISGWYKGVDLYSELLIS